MLLSNVVLSLIFACLFGYGGTNSTCPPRQYWDSGTRKCDPCSDICRNSQLQGTTEKCEKECPNWTPDAGEVTVNPSVTVSTSVTSSTDKSRSTTEKHKDGTNGGLPIYGIVLIAVSPLTVIGIGITVYRCYYRGRDVTECKCGNYLKDCCRKCHEVKRKKENDQADSQCMLEDERPKEQRKESSLFAQPEQNGLNDPTLPSGGKTAMRSLEGISDHQCTKRKENL